MYFRLNSRHRSFQHYTITLMAVVILMYLGLNSQHRSFQHYLITLIAVVILITVILVSPQNGVFTEATDEMVMVKDIEMFRSHQAYKELKLESWMFVLKPPEIRFSQFD